LIIEHDLRTVAALGRPNRADTRPDAALAAFVI
jgi:hypothetical protein